MPLNFSNAPWRGVAWRFVSWETRRLPRSFFPFLVFSSSSFFFLSSLSHRPLSCTQGLLPWLPRNRKGIFRFSVHGKAALAGRRGARRKSFPRGSWNAASLHAFCTATTAKHGRKFSKVYLLAKGWVAERKSTDKNQGENDEDESGARRPDEINTGLGEGERARWKFQADLSPRRRLGVGGSRNKEGNCRECSAAALHIFTAGPFMNVL